MESHHAVTARNTEIPHCDCIQRKAACGTFIAQPVMHKLGAHGTQCLRLDGTICCLRIDGTMCVWAQNPGSPHC